MDNITFKVVYGCLNVEYTYERRKAVSLWPYTHNNIIMHCRPQRKHERVWGFWDLYIILYYFFASTTPTTSAATAATTNPTTVVTTQNDILSVRFREPPPVECVQHMFGVRVTCASRIRFGYTFFSRSKLIHTHTHITTTTPRGVIFFLFKYNPHAIHHAISRLVFVWRVPARGYCVYGIILYYVYVFFPLSANEWRVVLFIKFIVCYTRTGLVNVPR